MVNAVVAAEEAVESDVLALRGYTRCRSRRAGVEEAAGMSVKPALCGSSRAAYSSIPMSASVKRKKDKRGSAFRLVGL